MTSQLGSQQASARHCSRDLKRGGVWAWLFQTCVSGKVVWTVWLCGRVRRRRSIHPVYRFTRSAFVRWTCRTRWSRDGCGVMSPTVCVKTTSTKPPNTNASWGQHRDI